MSYDQKPSRIKLVSSGAPARAPQVEISNPQAVGRPTEDGRPVAERARRPALIRTAPFFIGCAIGGVGLAAWPHLAS